jgi:hypothetical protein
MNSTITDPTPENSLQRSKDYAGADTPGAIDQERRHE